VTDAAVRHVVTGYTREAGVRGLERELGRLLRKAAVKIASTGEPDTAGGGEAPATEEAGGRRPGSPEATRSILLDVEDVEKALGRPKFYDEAADRTGVPGVATGLAVTGAGGDVLFVEATAMPTDGGGGLAITGQLGDVMKESAEIALSYVRSHAEALGLPAESFDKRRFHLHVPAGAVPKDGPSAGVTMATALVSLLTGRPVKSTVGMTGEVTLSGRVLPIGGVKQKVLAAHRAGLTEVVLPARNGPDLDDVPEPVREAMTFHLAEDIVQVLGWALEDAPASRSQAA
jgi:ATP-dependent Lon protease